VVIVESLEELLDVSEIALRAVALPAGGTAVLAESGWFKALALDLAEQVALPLPELTEATYAGLRAALPDFIPPSNPLDLTAQALVDPDLYRRTLNVLADEPEFGSIVIAIILTDESTCRLKLPPIIQALESLAPQKAIIFVGMDEGAYIPPEFVAALRALHVPFFPSPERGFRALARLTEQRGRALAPTAAARGAVPLLPEAAGVVPEYLSKEILAAAGIAIPSGGFARSASEAAAIAERIGFPVALKAQAAALSHKTDAGGVILGLNDARAVETGWMQLHANVARAAPHVTLDGVLVETMARRGVELIVGARNDAEWGAVVLVGLGGVLAEILQDSRLIPATLTRPQIVEELYRLKSAALLRGYRGAPALDIDAAADIVAKVGALVSATDRIREVDINPVVLYPAGEGGVALDALIVLG
jgi:acyl-CoA synthetase (NDP forming)